MLQKFISGFLSVFRFGAIPIKTNVNKFGITEYIDIVECDIYCSFEKLRNNHERNKEIFYK